MRQPNSKLHTKNPADEGQSPYSNHLLAMCDITKTFPGVRALNAVNLRLERGEVLGLIGENGAGKSTLMKILSGVHSMDEGQIYLDSRPVQIKDPHQAQQLGISIIYQEFNLMPNMSVQENIYLGREPSQWGFVNYKELNDYAQQLLDRLHVALSPDALVKHLSVAEQQMVEIAKALSMDVQVIIMDEPTSALSETEVQALFEVIEDLKRQHMGVVFISHRLNEICTVCDHITVLRDGENAGNLSIEEADEDRLISMMVGSSLQEFFGQDQPVDRRSRPELAAGEPQVDTVLEVRGLTRQDSGVTGVDLEDVSLQLHRGEILGLAGLVGSGRTEVARAIFGADPIQKGEILVEGTRVAIHSPMNAIRQGIGLVPEDRKLQGLILGLSVRENTTLPNLDDISRFSFINLLQEERIVEEYVQKLQIRTPDIEQITRYLSGGNQQKVVIAKWLMQKPKILIMDEPTRGIDVGAKAEIHRLIHRLADNGVSIIMISSEFPELLAMTDRMVCLYEGKVSGTLETANATMESVMRCCSNYEEVKI